MTDFPSSPMVLFAGVAALLLAAMVILSWGKRIPRQGDWLAATWLILLLGVIIFQCILLQEDALQPSYWSGGWIWPKDENGAITVGLIRDVMGLSFAALSVLAAVMVLITVSSSAAPEGEERRERLFASLAVSTAGGVLAWTALTPWLSLLGVGVSVGGGFLALGSRWHLSKEAVLAARYGWERLGGLSLSMLGLCVLAGPRLSLGLAAGAESWATVPGHPMLDYLGTALLCIGCAAQLQPFPLLGWLMAESETPTPVRIFAAQVLPAWGIFAVFTRLEPQLHAIGVLPFLGWFALASCVLASVAGLFKESWRLTLGAWISAGFSLALAALAFAGPVPALCLVVSVGLGGTALAAFATALEQGGAASQPYTQRASWAKAGCVAAALAGTGFLGFVGAEGGVRWVGALLSEPGMAVASALGLFLGALVAWKAAFLGVRSKSATQAAWGAILPGWLLLLMASAWIWTGTLTGAALPEQPDKVLPSLLFAFISSKDAVGLDELLFAASSGVYWGAWLLAVVTSYWMVAARPDLWPSILKSTPKFSVFVASGYGIDRVSKKVLKGLGAVGRGSVYLVDRMAWGQWVPLFTGTFVRKGSRTVATADATLSWVIGGSPRRWVEWLAKLLQMIQNGDVQWYLFFAVGSGLMIFARFMLKG